MNIFKKQGKKEKIDAQLSRVGFKITYNEKDNHISATLQPTSRYNEKSDSPKEWMETIKNRIESDLLPNKTFSIKLASSEEVI